MSMASSSRELIEDSLSIQAQWWDDQITEDDWINPIFTN